MEEAKVEVVCAGLALGFDDTDEMVVVPLTAAQYLIVETLLGIEIVGDPTEDGDIYVASDEALEDVALPLLADAAKARAEAKRKATQE